MLSSTTSQYVDWGSLNNEANAVADIATIDENPIVACHSESQTEYDFHYRLPAPFAADVNLDGQFSSDDLVSDYQSGSNLNPSSEMLRLLPLFESSKFIAYEDDSTFVAFGECQVDQLVAQFPEAEVTTHSVTDQESGVLESDVIHLRLPGQMQIRAVRSYDASGRLRSTAVDYHLTDDGVIYSRSQTMFDVDTKLPESHVTWIFDRNGIVMRTTYTQLQPEKEYQITDVQEFDKTENIVGRKVLYFDREGRVLTRIDFEWPTATTPVLVIRSANQDGALSATTFELDSDSTFLNNPIVDWDTAYLTQVRDGLGAAVDAIGDEITEVLRMNRPVGFDQIESTMQMADISGDKADRYRNLIRYFDIAIDLAAAHASGDWSDVIRGSRDVIDDRTGTWQPSFLSFMENEQLTVPLPPLDRILPNSTLVRRSAQLANAYRERMTGSPTTQYRHVTINPSRHVDSILESMRRVKAQIRLVEHNSNGAIPVFDWIFATDRPDSEAVEMTNIVPMSGWFFFDERPDGTYANEDVNEAVLRQRVDKMLTDGDAFHVMNIEHWKIDGAPAESAESLEKLKRTLDLIHDTNPNLMIGLYRLLPMRNLNVSSESPDALYQEWQRKNEYNMSVLGPSVDLLFPSLYTLHLGDESRTTEEHWAAFAEENVREARRISGGKPVIPFLALYYHPNGNLNPKGWQWIEPELLTFQLLKLDGLADGVTLYNDRRIDWSNLVEHGIGQVPELLALAHRNGRVDAALSYYEFWLRSNQDELIEKLQIEIQLLDASQSGLLTSDEIISLQTRLASLPSIWPSLISLISDGG